MKHVSSYNLNKTDNSFGLLYIVSTIECIKMGGPYLDASRCLLFRGRSLFSACNVRSVPFN